MDALAIANYYVEKAKSDSEAPSLTLLRLVKYVYIAYGFALAIINRCIINERFRSSCHSSTLSFPFKITLILMTQKTSKSFLENALAF